MTPQPAQSDTHWARVVPCPHCSAEPGKPCLNWAGAQLAGSVHSEREGAALVAGHRRPDRWNVPSAPDRVPPRECIRAARDALNNAYSHPGVTDAAHALGFIAEAVDWQRRALEQMA